MTILKRILSWWNKPIIREKPVSVKNAQTNEDSLRVEHIPFIEPIGEALKVKPPEYPIGLSRVTEGVFKPVDSFYPSNDCYDLIKKFEGFSPVKYLCPAGVPTIGYGHAIKKGESFPAGITKEQAHSLLVSDAANAAYCVKTLVTNTITQGMLDALVSFVYNLGWGQFQKSTMLKHINKGNYKLAQREFSRWVFSNGKKLNGLVTRREAESTLFGKGL